MEFPKKVNWIGQGSGYSSRKNAITKLAERHNQNSAKGSIFAKVGKKGAGDFWGKKLNKEEYATVTDS